MRSAIDRWRELLPGWGIPEAILAAAPESPWGFPPELLAARAETARDLPDSAFLRIARAAVPDGGSVLDVGVGGGAASLPLSPPAASIVGVDSTADVLARFAALAEAHGIAATVIEGTWPEVAHRTPRCDVVVCAHVLYNVRDLAPFVAALDDHALRRVAIEITAEHPLAWMSDLWLRFHRLRRPDGPTADDAQAALAEMGLDVHREEEIRRTRSSGFALRQDAVALIRRRLCLPPDRDDEVAEALGARLERIDGLWLAGPGEQRVVALWWEPRHARSGNRPAGHHPARRET